MKATLTRISKTDKQVLGQIDAGEFSCFTLELPDLNNDGIANNEIRKSCIPDGVYDITAENHRKFGWCYRVHNVSGRTGVLIHSGTHYKHTLGCILPGTEQRDITGDGIIDNVSSRKALNALVDLKITELEIISV